MLLFAARLEAEQRLVELGGALRSFTRTET